MQTLETVKARSQASLNTLMEKSKAQPDEVKTWGVTAGGALVGALALTAAANGILAILATLAVPPVALTVGAVGGGILGWNYMRGRQEAGQADVPTEAVPVAASAALAPEAPYEAAPEPTATTDTPVSPVAPVAEAAPSVDAISVQESATMVTATESLITPVAPDDLEAINGIGPVYASRLQAAGIHTFAQLAELTPEHIHEIIGPMRSGHMIEAESWIVEARQRAASSAA
ncbi:MAG: helix-hairpin-helix domain-containing protein [Caldilineaceae bacterium]